jgi:hypothetical protein
MSGSKEEARALGATLKHTDFIVQPFDEAERDFVLGFVVVHRFDNDPPSKDTAAVTESAYRGIDKAQFGHLLKLILDAAPEPVRPHS